MSDMSCGRADGGAPNDPADMSVTGAIDRYLRKRQTDATARTLRSYRNSLGTFAEWTVAQGITRIGDLTAWHLDEYDHQIRRSEYAPTTIKGLLTTLRTFLKYAERIGAVEEDLHEAIDVPNLEKNEETIDEKLATEDATSAIRFFRNSPQYYGHPMHAFLEVAWHSGARMGSIRGLDLEDYDADAQTLWFRHRPATGTPLKNKDDGERYIGISSAVCDVLDTYIVRERFDKRDENGREPLFAGRQGRPSFSTLRAWSYQATQPCLWTACPHGKRRGPVNGHIARMRQSVRVHDLPIAFELGR